MGLCLGSRMERCPGPSISGPSDPAAAGQWVVLPPVRWLSWISWGGAPRLPLAAQRVGREECFVWGVAMGIAGLCPSSHGTQWEEDWVAQ